MVADDLTIISDSPCKLQVLLGIAEHDAACQRYSFSETKTKIISINRKKHTREILLNKKPLQFSTEEKHLGIYRSNTLSNAPTINNRIKSARRAMYQLMGAGLYGYNGINPTVSKHLIDMYILPILIYGLEALTLTPKDIEPLEKFYKNTLRMIQHLPQSTAKQICYLLLGALPVEAHIHINTLNHLGSIMRRKDSPEYNILERQIAIKEKNSRSWAIYAKSLLKKYSLPRISTMLYNTPPKSHWRTTVKRQIQSFWYTQLQEQADQKSTLQHINIKYFKPGVPHPIWSSAGHDPLIIQRAAIHAKLSTQRYPLNNNYVSGNKSSCAESKKHLCPSCKAAPETTPHFVLECPNYIQQRKIHFTKISTELRSHRFEANQDNIFQAIMDPSWLSEEINFIENLTSEARTYIFNIHLQRSLYLRQKRGKTVANAVSSF